MSCSWSFLSSNRALPSYFPSQRRSTSLLINSKYTKPSIYNPKAPNGLFSKYMNRLCQEKTTLVLQFGALLATVEQPALAVTGDNYEIDLKSALIEGGFVAFWYFLIMPPVILNWLRLRWYKRQLLEMYLQFMILLWAPFVNFRRLPRDPTMEYPWSTPQDPALKDPRSS
eukprot:TRINITY_DN8338_c0_g2_i4.p1 TRINITY_DN8338_c0_g2~~TRINITY_DN8338_c0_g2_i4.p1  ORF type:complete len:170 (+),score=15.25 TRINITY_DN8338_c0_g2_i4:134-643(+)